MTELETLAEQLKGVQATAQKAFGQILAPEMMAEMNEAQKDIITRAQNAFSLDGVTPGEKIEQLQKILTDVTNINK